MMSQVALSQALCSPVRHIHPPCGIVKTIILFEEPLWRAFSPRRVDHRSCVMASAILNEPIVTGSGSDEVICATILTLTPPERRG